MLKNDIKVYYNVKEIIKLYGLNKILKIISKLDNYLKSIMIIKIMSKNKNYYKKKKNKNKLMKNKKLI